MTDQTGQKRVYPRSLWVWVGYWCWLFMVMHVPLMKTGPFHVDHTDKVIHFGFYFLLVRLGGHYQISSGRRITMGLLILWALIYSAYAGLDEWLQPLVGRTMSLGDWLADVAGIASASWWMLLRQRATTLSEHPPSSDSTIDM